MIPAHRDRAVAPCWRGSWWRVSCAGEEIQQLKAVGAQNRRLADDRGAVGQPVVERPIGVTPQSP